MKPYFVTDHAKERAKQRLSMNVTKEDAVNITHAYESGEHYGCIPSETIQGTYIMLLDVRGRLGAWCIHPQHRMIISVLPIHFNKFRSLEKLVLGAMTTQEDDHYDQDETENEVDSSVYPE